MSLKDNPCRKFQANIFNKSKCQNCFKPRESHLLNDEDLNQVSKSLINFHCISLLMGEEILLLSFCLMCAFQTCCHVLIDHEVQRLG